MRYSGLLLCALLCTGCVKTIVLNSMIQPNGFIADKSSDGAGVVCSQGLLSHTEQTNPSTQVGSAITYEFALGEPLCAALVRSVEVSYRTATRTQSPSRGQFGRLVKFDLQSTAFDIQLTDNGWGGITSRVSFTVSVAVEGYGPDMRLLNRSVLSGTSIVTRRGVDTDKVVKEAAEAALQQLADNTSNALVAGLAEPRPPRDAWGSRSGVPASPQR